LKTDARKEYVTINENLKKDIEFLEGRQRNLIEQIKEECKEQEEHF
jgi:hypothetical protein